MWKPRETMFRNCFCNTGQKLIACVVCHGSRIQGWCFRTRLFQLRGRSVRSQMGKLVSMHTHTHTHTSSNQVLQSWRASLNMLVYKCSRVITQISSPFDTQRSTFDTHHNSGILWLNSIRTYRADRAHGLWQFWPDRHDHHLPSKIKKQNIL